jgi:phosphoribosyl 1,2-cyclic phosphodiesterase
LDEGSGLRLSVLSSGSSGNATYIEGEGGGLLVDAGLPCRRIEGLLARIGRSLDDVRGVLLTHGHADHTSGVRSLVRECRVEVFAAPGIGESLGATSLVPGETFGVANLAATFFEVPHDSSTCGLHISDGEREVAMATDLGEAGPEVLRRMRGAEAVVVEAKAPDLLVERPPLEPASGEGGAGARAARAQGPHPRPPLEDEQLPCQSLRHRAQDA